MCSSDTKEVGRHYFGARTPKKYSGRSRRHRTSGRTKQVCRSSKYKYKYTHFTKVSRTPKHVSADLEFCTGSDVRPTDSVVCAILCHKYISYVYLHLYLYYGLRPPGCDCSRIYTNTKYTYVQPLEAAALAAPIIGEVIAAEIGGVALSKLVVVASAHAGLSQRRRICALALQMRALMCKRRHALHVCKERRVADRAVVAGVGRSAYLVLVPHLSALVFKEAFRVTKESFVQLVACLEPDRAFQKPGLAVHVQTLVCLYRLDVPQRRAVLMWPRDVERVSCCEGWRVCDDSFDSR